MIFRRTDKATGLPLNWRYRLSFLLPVRFATIYGVERDGMVITNAARWWQWRGRIFRHFSREFDWATPVT